MEKNFRIEILITKMHSRDWKRQVQIYFNQKQKIYELLMQFIENTEDDSIDFQNFINYIKNQKLNLDREEFEHVLQLISNISTNYNRQTGLFNKI